MEKITLRSAFALGLVILLSGGFSACTFVEDRTPDATHVIEDEPDSTSVHVEDKGSPVSVPAPTGGDKADNVNVSVEQPAQGGTKGGADNAADTGATSAPAGNNAH